MRLLLWLVLLTLSASVLAAWIGFCYFMAAGQSWGLVVAASPPMIWLLWLMVFHGREQ